MGDSIKMSTEWLIGLLTGLLAGSGITIIIFSFTLRKKANNEKIL